MIIQPEIIHIISDSTNWKLLAGNLIVDCYECVYEPHLVFCVKGVVTVVLIFVFSGSEMAENPKVHGAARLYV